MNAEDVIRELGLSPHPEGGHFREVFRSARPVGSQAHDGERSASTAIYFLLTTADFSAVHRVRSDEVWHHYLGDPLELHCFDGATHQTVCLGRDLERGERPLFVVPAQALQAARVSSGPAGFALCGCTVAPGFDFADFEMPPRAELLARYPEQRDWLREFTRSSP